ncbi:MAG: 1-(5-phosphoribosyl)-5-[(5-phosphoribosylamino)methylideneamino]imidazole-4-carboxamide isomerase [Zetaproteobacteria bacterium]|nr:MAG: 1-(5-phosphoribosyl)-5-[(5-phosphoribosylamino)methylideneamino]imidazole-4-carboxamide isomerase [Zetaproteobacteria bacterium]
MADDPLQDQTAVAVALNPAASTADGSAAGPFSFLLIPAIDLKGGHCVRLRQGRMDTATDYGDDPAAMALRWQQAGAQRLHLVDLDGAFAGRPANREAVAAVCRAVKIPVQLGGGVRDLATIEAMLALGVDRVILGSAAAADPELVEEACRAFPDRVCVGIDARDGRVAVHGWGETTEIAAADLARRFSDAGVAAIIYTDIARDGMLTGPNIAATVALARSISTPVIASGGIACLDDVLALAAHSLDGIAGAITGRALYEGRLDLAGALTALAARAPSP